MITYPTVKMNVQLKSNRVWILLILKCMVSSGGHEGYHHDITNHFSLTLDQEAELWIQYPKRYRGSFSRVIRHPDFNVVSIANHMGYWKK